MSNGSRTCSRSNLSPPAVLVLVFLASMGLRCDGGGPLDSDAEPATGDIQGVVTGDGAPRSGVKVTLTNSGSGAATTFTAANGEYAFFDLAPGTYAVAISDFAGMRCVNVLAAIVVEGEGVEVDFPCTTPLPTGTVAGRVTVNGFGAEGIVVALREASKAIRTDDHGAYRFTDVRPGTETLQIGIGGIDNEDLQQCPTTRVEVTVPAGGTAEVDFECTGQVITGRVTLDGNPWPGVIVRMCGEDEFDSTLACIIPAEVTDSEGRYVYTSLSSRPDGYFYSGALWGDFVLVESLMPDVICQIQPLQFSVDAGVTVTQDIRCSRP